MVSVKDLNPDAVVPSSTQHLHMASSLVIMTGCQCMTAESLRLSPAPGSESVSILSQAGRPSSESQSQLLESSGIPINVDMLGIYLVYTWYIYVT
jgi:hypothetical protein